MNLMNPDHLYSFFDAEKLVSDFEQVLNLYGIDIVNKSELERLCLNITNILEIHLKPHLRDPAIDIRIPLRDFAGLLELMIKIVKAKNHPYFHQIIPHLKKLNISNPLQNTYTKSLNQENNKIFELYIATLCLGLNTDKIYVDDPDVSKGDNPDVLALINNKMWGFGCKSLHSSHPQTIFDNLVKAVDQIEKSPAKIGIPVFNIKNIIDHDEYWPIVNDDDEIEYGAFIDINIPISMMYSFVDELQERIINHIGNDNLKEIFKNKKSQPGCLVYCPTTTSFVLNKQPVTTRLNIFNIMNFDNISMECMDVCYQLNHQLQLTK